MKFRNAKFLKDGAIDLEFDHPELGWVPFTATATDTVGYGQLLHAQALEAKPAPYVPPVEPEPVRTLTRKQFTFLLRLTGFGAVWDALMNAAEAKGDRITAAALEAERAGDVFRLDRTLQVVASMREQAAKLVPDVDLSEAAIREAWETAEQFKGIGHVSG